MLLTRTRKFRLGAAIAASTLLINALQGKLSKQSEGTTNGGDAKEKAVEKATVEAPRASRVLAGPILFTAGLLSYSVISQSELVKKRIGQ